MREKGMVGAAMGTTALSASGQWWAVPVKAGPVTRFVLIDTQNKTRRCSWSAIPSAIRSSARTTTTDPLCRATDRPGLADRSQRRKESPDLPARRQDAMGDARGLGARPPHRRLRRLAARHEDDRRRPGGRAPTHVFCDMARGAGRRRRTVCLRHQFSRSWLAHLRRRRRSSRRCGISLRQRSIVRGQALGWAVSLQRRASRGGGSPAYASAPAFLRRTVRVWSSPGTRPATLRSTR